MTHLELHTAIAAAPEVCFDLSLDIDEHVRGSKGRERAVAGTTSGRIGLGETVTWRARHFGVLWRMTSEIVELDRPHRFFDRMVSGPFATWRHEHLFVPTAVGTDMVDVVDYAAPAGWIGSAVDALVLRGYMTRLLLERDAHIKRLAESRT